MTFEQLKMEMLADEKDVRFALYALENYLLVCNAELLETDYAVSLRRILDDMLESHMSHRR